MKGVLSFLLVVVLSGCLDFSAARAKCAEAGACVGETPPTLVSSTPAANATDVAVGTGFTLTFSEPMDKASVKLSLSPVVALQGPVFTAGGDDTVATFTAAAALAPSTVYTATVTGQSVTGVAIGSTQLTFTTASATDTTAPTMNSSPSTGSTGVTVGTHLVLFFSEPMNPASLSLVTQPEASWGAVSWNEQNTMASFDSPPSSLKGSSTYTIGVSATDVAGNGLAPSSATITFTTSTAPDTAPPTVVATQPTDGSSGVNVASDLSVTFSEPMLRSTVGVLTVTPSTGCTPTFDASNTVLLCHPSSSLAFATQYTVTISTTAKDESGNALVSPLTFTFTTGPAPDTTPPTVVPSPADGATGVALDTALMLTFSEPIDQTTVQVVMAGFDWGTPSWDAAGRVVTFTPPKPLSADTQYQFAVIAADLANNFIDVGQGTFGFHTQTAPDLTAPTIIGTQPGAGATSVAVTSDLVVTFSEPMAATTTTALSLSPAVTAACALDATSMVLTCKHTSQPFAVTTTYTATLDPTKAKDLAGNPLGGTNSFSFTSGSEPDTTHPTIVSATPLNSAKGVYEGTGLTVRFSEPMDKAATQSAFAVSLPTGRTFSSYSWSADGTQITAHPTPSFAIGQAVTWQVSTTAKDLSGNTLATTQSFTFRVAYQKSATVYASTASTTVRRTPANRGAFTYAAQPASATTLAGGVLPQLGVHAVDRAIMTFDLTALASTFVSAVSADLILTHQATSGTPYSSLGSLRLERILPAAGSTPSAFFTAPAETTGPCPTFTCSTSVSVATAPISWSSKTIPMTPDVDRTGRSTLTYRLRFANDTTASSPLGTESFASATNATTASRPRLNITYRSTDP